MASEFSITKCLKWCVELPSKECPLDSPVFTMKGNECLFRLALAQSGPAGSDTWYYDLHLEFKSKHAEYKPCSGNLQVGFKNEQSLIVSEKAIQISEPSSKLIWYDTEYNLHTKLPPDYAVGNWIKFLFSFDDVVESDLNISKKANDKCLQTSSYMRTDVPVESITEYFCRLLDSGPNHDAEIKCDEHSIKAHKIILCARSEVFKAMLESDMLEGRTGIVEIHDMDINYVQDFVRYLYTGTIPELIFDNAKVLYEAGDKYAIRSLMLRCSEYLQDNLSPENVFDCFALADAHSDHKLKDIITTYLLEKKIYLKNKHWLPFCERFPKIVIEVYRLSYGNVAEE